MDWDKLKIFYTAATTLSFTATAKILKVTQSAVSRSMGGFEETLKTRLFLKNSRGITLTEQGEMLLKTTREVFSELIMVENQIREESSGHLMPLKLTATTGFGSFWIAPKLKKFSEQYPEIKLSFILSDEIVDLAVNESDIMIFHEKVNDSNLICEPFLTKKFKIYSSREYLFKNGVPLNLQDMKNHKIITFGEDVNLMPALDSNWLIKSAGGEHPIKPYMKINNLFAILKAVESGMGIALLPEYIIKKSKNLVEILPDSGSPEFTFYLTYFTTMKDSARVRAICDFLKQEALEENA